jgi:hypothetical protein
MSRLRSFARSLALLALLGRAASAAAEDAPRPTPPVETPVVPEQGPPPGPKDPVAGFAGERAFLRSPGNEVVLMPTLRLMVGGAFLPRGVPTSGFYLRRARVGLSGWMGSQFYFDVGGDVAPTSDPAAPGGAAAADAYVAFAPEDDLVIVQAGQFDAPFTLENRTAEPYLPFIERSLAVRSLLPSNKEVGVMAHGGDAARSLYYSAGVFNGDGPGVRNADSQVDVIGRVVVSPLARTSLELFRRLALGGSGWYGQHQAGTRFPTQVTPGGFVVFDPTWTSGQFPDQAFLALNQRGKMMALAGELSVPITREFGLRGEFIFKKQDLAEDALNLDGSTTPRGRATLQGIGGYGEAWVWLMGDDRQLPAPGLQLPVRLGSVTEPAQQHGVMIAARGELLKQDLTSTATALGNPNLATTRIVEVTAAVNYWYGRRVRASANYVFTLADATSERVKSIVAAGKYEHELLFLVGVAM